MNRFIFVSLCLAAMAGSLLAAEARSRGGRGGDRGERTERSDRGGGGGGAEDYRGQYGVISEQNIFLRNRYRPPTSRPASTPREPRSPEQSFVLRGVVLEEGEHRAYFEDAARRTMMRVRAGDEIARGRITQVEIDAVLYEGPDQQVWVIVGSDLTSRTPTPASLVAAAAAATEGENGQPAAASIDPDDPNLSLAERMKLRRMQEMNR